MILLFNAVGNFMEAFRALTNLRKLWQTITNLVLAHIHNVYILNYLEVRS